MAEGGIEYEMREIDILDGEHRSGHFRSINPAGMVPAMVTPEGHTLHETPGICLYLAERHGLDQIVPAAGDGTRGPFLSGLFYLTSELEPTMKRYFYPHRYVLREEDIPGIRQQSFRSALKNILFLNRHLTDHGPYYLGDRFSLVDLNMTYWSTFLNEVEHALDPAPAVLECMKRVRNRPKLQPYFGRIERMKAEYAALQSRGTGVR